MFDLRASGALEVDADQIIIVFRDDQADEQATLSEGRFIVASHAKAGGPARFRFDGERQTFTEWDEAYERACARWGSRAGGETA